MSKHLSRCGAALAILVMTTSAGAAEPRPASRHLGLTLSYFGETGTHPGLLAAVDYPLLGAGGPHELLARANLGFYVHPRMYVGLFAGGELAYRATASFGLRGEVAAGVAHLQTFTASTLYEVQSDGRVTELTDGGRPAFMPSATVGVGWDFARRSGPPIAVMLRAQTFWQVPFNTRCLLHIAGILGVTYTL